MFDVVDLLVLVWSAIHGLDDPFVIVVAASLGGGTLAAMRRLDSMREGESWHKAAGRVIVGAIITATTSGAAAAVGLQLAPNYPKLVLGLIVFVSGVVDTTTDDGRAWVQREIFGRLLAMFDAARGGKYNPPAPPGPSVPQTPSPSQPAPQGQQPSTPSSPGGKVESTPTTHQPKKGAW